MRCVDCPHLYVSTGDGRFTQPVTPLGRDALRKRQKWFARQSRFICGEGLESLENLALDSVFDAVTNDRNCSGFEWPEAASNIDAAAGRRTVKLPAWLVAVMVITAVAALVAAVAAVWAALT